MYCIILIHEELAVTPLVALASDPSSRDDEAIYWEFRDVVFEDVVFGNNSSVTRY